MLPGPVVYEVVPSEVSGIMALSVPRTKKQVDILLMFPVGCFCLNIYTVDAVKTY